MASLSKYSSLSNLFLFTVFLCLFYRTLKFWSGH